MTHVKKNHFIIAREGVSIPVNKVIFIESNLHKVIFHVLGKDGKEIEYSDRCRLCEVEELLSGLPFCRVHQSYLVNMTYIDSIKRYCVILSTGRQINVSKKRYSLSREKILEYKGTI